jgi:hypothetical protein
MVHRRERGGGGIRSGQRGRKCARNQYVTTLHLCWPTRCLFAAADRSCQQMRLLKAACRWTAYRGWRRTSYPLMSEKMCPRTYLVCTLSFNRFKQQTLALCYERSPANAHHHPHRSHSRCSVRNAILLKWQTNLTKFLPRAEACQGFKVRTQVGRSCVGSTISDPNPFPVR